MKRNIIIISFFILLSASLIFASSCSCGDPDCEFHGLTSNKVINCPKWIGCASYNVCSIFKCEVCGCEVCNCGEDYAEAYGDGSSSIVDESEIIEETVTLVQNKAGYDYDDKYITVKVEFQHLTKKLTKAVSFSLKVYDNEVLVGEAVISRYNNFTSSKISIFDEGSYTGYFNIKIDRYIIGEYTFKLDDVILCI